MSPKTILPSSVVVLSWNKGVSELSFDAEVFSSSTVREVSLQDQGTKVSVALSFIDSNKEKGVKDKRNLNKFLLLLLTKFNDYVILFVS